jgi:hypothetical protein
MAQKERWRWKSQKEAGKAQKRSWKVSERKNVKKGLERRVANEK